MHEGPRVETIGLLAASGPLRIGN